MKKSLMFLLVLVLFVFLTGSIDILNAQKKLSWTGCGITKKAFMKEIAKAYKAKTGVAIGISGGGATKGIRFIASGKSNLGGTCRHQLVNKVGKIHTAEKNAKLIQVAWDSIVAITHPDNPVDNIKVSDLKEIYEGKITNWKAIGGSDTKISLIERKGKISGVGYMFRLLVFNNKDMVFKGVSASVKSSGPLERKCETMVDAIGVTGISSAKKRKVKVLALDGVKPTKVNVGSGKYPLYRPLYLSVNKKITPDVQKVIDYILSDEGQAIISKAGTVNLKEGAKLVKLWAAKKKTL